MSLERGLCDAALHAAAATVYDSNANEPSSSRLCDVFLDHRCDVFRPEAVEIQLGTNR